MVLDLQFDNRRRRRVPAIERRVRVVPRGAVVAICDEGDLARCGEPLSSRFAELGYDVDVVDVAELASFPGDEAEAIETIRGMLEVISGRGWAADQTALVGYGRGGGTVLLACAELAVAAAVSVAPTFGEPTGRTPLDRVARSVRTPWLGLFGGLDPSVQGAEIAQLQRRLLGESSEYVQVVVYDHADGSFYRDEAGSSARDAGFDSWQRTVEWLSQRVAPLATSNAKRWARRRQVGEDV